MRTFYSILFTLFLSLLACDIKEETTQNEELDKLNNLYENIHTLATSKTCEESDDWNFTPNGHKACGGPKEYIAYSSNIDTTLFLELVKEYTSLEKEYNQKWEIVSDCSTPQEPVSVTCKDNVPTFNY